MTINYNKNGGTQQIATYSECITNISVSDPNSWGLTYTASNGIVNLTAPSNSNAERSEIVVISYKAGTTNCQKSLEITQDSGIVPVTKVFTYCDGTTANTLSMNSDSQRYRYCIISKIGNDGGMPYHLVNSCNWVHLTTGTTYFVLDFDGNDSGVDRSCNVVLQQNNSDLQISLAVTQSATDCERFLDSCCGVSSYSHPEHDISLHYEQGSKNYDGILYGSTFHVTNTLPSWLDVSADTTNNIITYTALEENPGDARSFRVELALDSTTGTNVCNTANVLVRQYANPSTLMTCNFNLTYTGSSTVSVASVRFLFGNGYDTYMRVSETFTPNQTIQQSFSFPKILNGQELLIGNPITVIYSGGATATNANISNLTIQSDSTYNITFS